MANSAGKPGSSSNETQAAPGFTNSLFELNVSNGTTPQGSSSPPQSSPSPPPSNNANNNSSSSNSPPSPPPSNSPPPTPPSASNNPSPPSPTSDLPPPKASPPPPQTTSPPPTSSSSSPPPSPPSPTASSKESPPLSPPPSSPPPPGPPSDDNAPSPPSNENANPPPSEGSQSPPPPPPPAEFISPPSLLSPPIESSQPPELSPPIGITPTGPKSSSPSPPPPHRGTPSLGPPSNAKSEGGNADSPSSSTSSYNTGKTVAGVGVAVASVFLISLIAIFFVVSKRRKRRRADAYATHYMPPSSFSVKSDGYYYAQQQSMGNSGPADPYQTPTHSHLVNSYGNGSQRGQMYPGGGPESGVIGGGKTFFSYEELMEITNGFSSQNILGEGGFGCVYKGWLPDGKVVAVKQLKAGSGQGEREFRAEVEIISRVHHRYLVSLVGYCISERHRLLIYEFVPNKTLEYHLYEGSPVLDWPKRVKIAIGAAKGIAYLHEDCHPKIIHRDIKSANILLDDDFEAQVADFGLAKLNDSTQTHVSTRVMGTFGYMAPEYASSGKLTDRSDVFSFGVVLLELITGRKPVDPTQPLGDESLVEWARPLLVQALETGDISELVDPRLQKHYVESEVFRMIESAAACVRHSAPKRPRMVQVVRALDSEGEMSDLSNGVRYGQSTVYDSGQYNQDIKKFRRMALGSNDSSEYDMHSGDYTSREASHGFPNSWKTSGEFTSGESETRAMTGHSRAQGNYVAPRF